MKKKEAELSKSHPGPQGSTILKNPKRLSGSFALLLILLLGVGGCQKAYYRTLEAMGYQKREILVDRVESAQSAQEEAKEQFESALDRFRAVVQVDGGPLEEKYEQLRDEYEQSTALAEKVRKRIEAVEEVAGALFAEWEEELEQYTSAELRRSSRKMLHQTRERYQPLITAMHRAEAKMAPVLGAFQDQVLFLKHNLNARAVASLKDELQTVQTEVSSLISEMEAAIREAEVFTAAMADQ